MRPPVRVALSPEELQACERFAFESAATQREIEFGNRATSPRPSAEVARDTLIGKIAEVGFAKHMLTMGVEVALDFNIYPDKLTGDAADAALFGCLIDVKATRPGSQWLLVEASRLEVRRKLRQLPTAFVMAITGWRRHDDRPTGEIELAGYSYLWDMCNPAHIGRRDAGLCSGVLGASFHRAGQTLPGKNFALQADNCARPARLLRRNWQALLMACFEIQLERNRHKQRRRSSQNPALDVAGVA